MKIKSKKGNWLYLTCIVLFFLLIGRPESRILLEAENLPSVLFLLILLVVNFAQKYYAQISQSISLEDGKLKIKKKQEEIELKISEVLMFTHIGNTLQIATEDVRVALDASFFAKRHIKQISTELNKMRDIQAG
jgi:hypothetical protein